MGSGGGNGAGAAYACLLSRQFPRGGGRGKRGERGRGRDERGLAAASTGWCRGCPARRAPGACVLLHPGRADRRRCLPFHSPKSKRSRSGARRRSWRRSAWRRRWCGLGGEGAGRGGIRRRGRVLLGREPIPYCRRRSSRARQRSRAAPAGACPRRARPLTRAARGAPAFRPCWSASAWPPRRRIRRRRRTSSTWSRPWCGGGGEGCRHGEREGGGAGAGPEAGVEQGEIGV
jgi:hypothetical protein